MSSSFVSKEIIKRKSHGKSNQYKFKNLETEGT